MPIKQNIKEKKVNEQKVKIKQKRVLDLIDQIYSSPTNPNFLKITRNALEEQLEPDENVIGYQVKFNNSNEGYTLQFKEVKLNNTFTKTINIDQSKYQLHMDMDNSVSQKNVKLVFNPAQYDIYNSDADGNKYVFFSREEIVKLDGNELVFSPAVIDFGNSIYVDSISSFSTIKIEGFNESIILVHNNPNEVSRYVLGLPCPPAWKPGAPIANS